ncbi:MAG: 2-hydroxyacid dehydrogenase [Betaproteobacteria bacterium]|nr:2-hydroxyacid dehydrogenase [Betaproteobacteria bacterium]
MVVAKEYAPTQQRLEAEFTIHKLYEAPDRDAFLKCHASSVRALATYTASGADAKLMDALPKLQLISHFGVGYDAIDVGAAKQRNIMVTNTPDVLNDCVADTAMSLVLNVMRQFPRSENWLRAGNWREVIGYPLTVSLGGKTLGILGLGRIGEAIARRAQAFGMKIAYHNRNRKNLPYAYFADAASLAKNCTVLLIATPGGAETRNLVDAKVLDALGPKGFVVNIARGSVIDEPVLIRYLQENRIAGAGLDVYVKEPQVPPELFALENAVIYPHVGSGTVETRTAMGDLQLENLRLFFAGKPVKTRVV